MTDILAIIPARIGSKGAPRKNLHSVGGKPLLVWTCEAAKQVSALQKVIVSTDDAAIAEVARQTGVEIPFLRPSQYATDTATAVDVVLHALDWFRENQDWIPDAVLWLQPTSPLRTREDIEEAITLFKEKNAPSVVSVSLSGHPGEWLKRVDQQGLLLPWLSGQNFPTRRQEATQTYELNGAIYLTQVSVLRNQKTFFPENTFAYVMPRERSLDIDTPWDLHLAHLILEEKGKI